MKKKTDQTKAIAELLPEGLSEVAITEIATLVNDVISEQVQEKIQVLESKVKGFIRSRVDEMKNLALAELESDNETIRNASLFESVKTLMALEIRSEDEGNVISDLVQEQEEFQTEVAMLTEELRKAFEENDKLAVSIAALSQKVDSLNEDKATLLDAVEILEESSTEPFKSSERAIVIAESVDTQEATDPQEINAFLTKEVMDAMSGLNS